MSGFELAFKYNLFNATYNLTIRGEMKLHYSKSFFMKYLLVAFPRKQEMRPPFSLKDSYVTVSKLCVLTFIFIIWMT